MHAAIRLPQLQHSRTTIAYCVFPACLFQQVYHITDSNNALTHNPSALCSIPLPESMKNSTRQLVGAKGRVARGAGRRGGVGEGRGVTSALPWGDDRCPAWWGQVAHTPLAHTPQHTPRDTIACPTNSRTPIAGGLLHSPRRCVWSVRHYMLLAAT